MAARQYRSVTMKYCHGCESMLPCEDFDRDSRTSDGMQTRCRECRRAYIHTGNHGEHTYDLGYLAAPDARAYLDSADQWLRGEIRARRSA
jgi:hypothetical protein